MCPKLFQIGPFPIYSFGLMLAIAFLVASYLLTEDFKRRKLNPEIASTVTFLALVLGIVGSKLMHLVENLSAFVANPLQMAFSPGGLTFHGGLILAIIGIYIYVRQKGIPFLVVADAAAPSLMLAYGIGRIGCHLAGDGDYGFPTSLPWGTDYSKGTYPPSIAFRDFPEITSQYPGGIVPDNVLCHPTPVYEFIACAIGFWILWRLRVKLQPAGKLFMLYLIFAGFERLAVEFLRLNPRLWLDLSQAQWISIGLIVAGTVGWFRLGQKRLSTTSSPRAD
ncbi:MAG: prolipoprotein diacylglyceryl transferase [Bacteroidetes bacterium]|jgi:phosphatidylglycerol:prolipoprotein diacylglycerol transferase|nr:prolipoprotein diacylglyceryl transferase [Bacteroidota bacterium]